MAALVGVANHFGYGPFTVFRQSHHNELFMPGDRLRYVQAAPSEPACAKEEQVLGGNILRLLKMRDAA